MVGKKKTAVKSTAVAKVKKAAPKKEASPAKKAKPAAAKASTAKAEKSTSKPVKASSTAGAGKAAPRTGLADDLSFRNYTPYQEKKGEQYMNEQQIAHFRDILEGWKRELMNKVDETVHHLQDEAANFPDPNDRASQESEFTLELRTRDRERKLIKKIEESLTALDNEDYGYCTSCGVEVGIRRLEARPTATECIDCKTLNEIREKQYGK
jgi:DnaK suppressor protein